jgi:hypothetical protein
MACVESYPPPATKELIENKGIEKGAEIGSLSFLLNYPCSIRESLQTSSCWCDIRFTKALLELKSSLAIF